jgi:organic radical activating enzyme
MSKRIRISEIFGPTIQGEGPLIGRPSIFVRTAGCDIGAVGAIRSMRSYRSITTNGP